jgi:hypothetical protein
VTTFAQERTVVTTEVVVIGKRGEQTRDAALNSAPVASDNIALCSGKLRCGRQQ